MEKTTVQYFLDYIHQWDKPVDVIFTKKDGTQRRVIGILDQKGRANKRDRIPLMCIETGSWKEFNINSVLNIQTFVDDYDPLELIA